MRTTFNTGPASLLEQISRLSTRLDKLQGQVTSGQRISQPEDDPLAISQVLQTQATARAATQYRTNIATLRAINTVTTASLRSVQSVSDRAGEIAILADGTRSTQELTIYASEVTQLIQQAVQAANANYNGNYVYAGTRNTQPPYTVATDAAGHVTSVTYNGNTSVARVDIAEGAAVAAAPPGPDAIGADFFNNLIALQNHLLAGDTAAITATDQPALAASEDLLLTQMAANGVFQARLTTADTIARNQIEALNADASRLADADLTDSVLLLTQTRTAYQAALQTGGSLLQVSLLDYLR